MTCDRLALRVSILLLITTFIPAVASAQRSGSSISNDRIFEAIGLREGITVCEIGAGDGALSIAAARIVGPTGRVYTSELGDERLKALRRKVEDSELPQITVVAGDPEKTNFPDAACDALFMRNVYHHFAEPARMNASIAASMKAGGHAAVVDFAPPNAEAPTPAERGKDGMHGVMPESVSGELKQAGFEEVCSEQGEQRWFMVVVKKAMGQ